MPLPWSCHFATVVYVCVLGLGHMNGFRPSAAGMAHKKDKKTKAKFTLRFSAIITGAS